jgi:hypothetical protein
MAAAHIAIGSMEAGRLERAQSGARGHEAWAAAEVRARRGPTPEVFFAKRLDNSRLVKVEDPRRAQEIRTMVMVAAMFLVVVMTYMWQHFSSVELGYKIEAQKQQVEQLREQNRQLALTEAQLTQPERVDRLAQRIGLESPRPEQFAAPAATDVAPGAPMLAQVADPAAGAQQAIGPATSAQ